MVFASVVRLLKNNLDRVVWIIIITGVVFRFFDLKWDGFYNLHPDEVNIATAIASLSDTKDFNPNFFAYGTMPITAIFWTKSLFQNILGIELSPYLIGRFISATLSSLCVFLIYFWAKDISKNFPVKDKWIFIFVTTLIFALSPAAIQAAHFMTFESILMTEYLLFGIFAKKYLLKNDKKYIVILSFISGAALATKITSLFLIGIFGILALYKYRKEIRKLFGVKSLILDILVFSLLSTITMLIFFPHMVLSYEKFISSLNYENAVATGQIVVFYTRQFINTYPIVFQMRGVMEFLLGSLIWVIFFIIGFIFLIVKYKKYPVFLIVILVLSLGWLPTNFLFVKWIRYSVYFLPYFSLIAAVGFLFIFQKFKYIKIYGVLVFTLITFINTMFFMNIYIQSDTRIEAASWAEKNIPNEAKILSETYDLGIIPFNKKFMKNIKLFDFYSLNRNSVFELAEDLENSDYIISPSPRVWGNTEGGIDETKNKYYQLLNQGKLGFSLVFTSKVSTDGPGFGFKPDDLEETFSVFDHPEVRIYKKNEIMNIKKYLELINNNEV